MPAWGVNTFMPIYGKCFAPTPCGNIVIMVIFQKTKVLRNFKVTLFSQRIKGAPLKTFFFSCPAENKNITRDFPLDIS
ncbi:MAG: hypothetical protein HCAMLNBO_01839 [Candidatus Brocadia fulgida]|nr:hypothetical protein [Candidatus Brocadia fulgida]